MCNVQKTNYLLIGKTREINWLDLKFFNLGIDAAVSERTGIAQ